jgi:hypothetical protein
MTKSKQGAKKNAVSATDAIVILKNDHKAVKKLFSEYERLCDGDADSDEKRALAIEICSEITVHATIEEEIFYPALREALDADNLLNEAEVEHESAKGLILQIEEMSPDEALFDAKVTVLGEYINHHVEEEEGEIFKEAKSADLDMEALGEELMERRAELRSELGLDDEDDSDDEEAVEDDESEVAPKARRKASP